MNYFLGFTILIVCSRVDGFFVPSEEAIEIRSELCRFIRSSIGEEELNRFVTETIEKQSVVDGTALSESWLDEKWFCIGIPSNFQLVSGDWAFELFVEFSKVTFRRAHTKFSSKLRMIERSRFQPTGEFRMLWEYTEGMGIWIEGRLTDNKRLELLAITNEEVIKLSP
jgi:hypothetical protein